MTRRRSVNGVERSEELRVESKRVSLDEFKRIVWLGVDIHATTLNPAMLYPTLAPPAQQKRSRSLGFITRVATVLFWRVLGMEVARFAPFVGEVFVIARLPTAPIAEKLGFRLPQCLRIL